MKVQKQRKYLIPIISMILCLIFLAGCNNMEETKNSDAPISKNSFKLNTIVTITLYDSQDETILDGALAVCDYYEELYSRTLETSELYHLNHGILPNVNGNANSFRVSDELADLLEYGLYYSNLSSGGFDITVAPITDLWDFTTTDAIVPDKKTIEKVLSAVGYLNVSVEGNTVTFDKEQIGVDLGAIAKGYIADRIKDYLLDNDVKSAMINLGGNVLAVGVKPNGEAFNIGIQKPFAGRNEIVATMDIKDMSVVSSGVYERYFIQEDTLYHHILNPTTGYPYLNDLISVTIISEESVDGDGLSTSCFALGLEKGLELINSLENTYAIFITKDYTLHYSEGFFENIIVTEVE